VAREGIHQCQYHMQLLSLEQPFNPAATTEGEAELGNIEATAGKKRSPKKLGLTLRPNSIRGSKVCLGCHKAFSWL